VKRLSRSLCLTEVTKLSPSTRCDADACEVDATQNDIVSRNRSKDFLKYLGTKRVVSHNELLAGEPVTVDVDRKGISIP
jgi:hypothetical protein